MTAARKITEAENILANLKKISNDEFKHELENFVKTVNDVFLHLLDEYNVKFELKIQRICIEKFKVIAKRSGKVEAISFLIWYEKEYRKLRNNPTFGYFLEENHTIQDINFDINSCVEFLEATKKMTYYAYENF